MIEYINIRLLIHSECKAVEIAIFNMEGKSSCVAYQQESEDPFHLKLKYVYF